MDNIDNLFNFTCNNNHTICLEIATFIKQQIYDKKTLDKNICKRYANYIFDSCMDCYRCNEHKNILLLIFNNLKLDNKLILKLMKLNDNSIYSKIIKKYTVTANTVNRIVPFADAQLTNLIISSNKFIKNSKTVELLCNKPYTFNILGPLKNLINSSRFRLTPNCIFYALNNKNFTLAEYLIIERISPDYMCLKQACLWRNKYIIKLILERGIKPTQECFRLLFPNDNVNEIIDLFVQYGYKIQYKDIVFATNNMCKLSCNSDIKLDNKFLELCYELNYFPYGDDFCKPTKKCLYRLCKNPSLSKLKKICASGIDIDIDIFEKLCCKKKNYQIVKWILENTDLKPTMKCIRNLVNDINNKTLQFIMNSFNGDQLIELNNLSKLHTQILCNLVTQKTEWRKVKKLISNNIKPNIICLREACKSKNNIRMVKLLIEECNISPDLICIKNIVSQFDIPVLKLLYQNYDQMHIVKENKPAINIVVDSKVNLKKLT